MLTLVFGLLIIAAVVAYLYWQLARTDMVVTSNIERPLPPREALRFALDNELPLKSPPPAGLGHNGGPPAKDWINAETVEELRKA